MATTKTDPAEGEFPELDEPVNDAGYREGRIDSVYTIQVEVTADSGKTAWADVATVTVPARTKRKRVIREGLEKANMKFDAGNSIKVRALNEESAHVLTVGLETPEPQLKIA